MIAHFSGQDGPSTLLVLGLAFVFMGARRALRGDGGWTGRGARWAGLGIVLLGAGLVAGLR